MESKCKSNFGMRLTQARIAAGLTPSQAAKKIDVDVSTVYAWESDTKQPREKSVRKLAQVYGVDAEQLLAEQAVSGRRLPRMREGKTGLGARLAHARYATGMTQAQAAEQIGVASMTLCNWENGITSPKADKMAAIARAYGVDVGTLIG